MKNYDNDILFLKKRMDVLISFEEYEKCARIKKWIDELEEKQKTNTKWKIKYLNLEYMSL